MTLTVPAAAQERAPSPLGSEDADTEAVRATFDPQGPFDDAGLPKAATDFAGGPSDRSVLERVRPDRRPEDWVGGVAALGGPSNDNCSAATVIPGNVVSYFPALLNTTGATTEGCEPLEGLCAGATTRSVWYEYVPDRDGLARISTCGSNYDTALSVFPSCGSSGQICFLPQPIACIDDSICGFASQQSVIFLDVVAGETYMIKVADAGAGSGGLLDFALEYFPPNDQCENATVINGVAFNPPLLSIHNADIDLCEAEESCELNNVGTSNSVWYAYTPPCDGLLSVNTNGSSYDTVLSIFDGCGIFVSIETCDLPNEIACDDDAGTGLNSQLVDIPVTGGAEYIIKVGGYNLTPDSGYLDFNLLFSGADPPVAEITNPAPFACACDIVAVEGSANSGDDAAVQWALEYQPVGGGSWTLIESSETPVTDALLAAWDVSLLSQGYYLVRLTVQNACGLTATAVQVVFVDHGFDTIVVHEPADTSVVGGLVCIDGTAWDRCPAEYTVTYRALGTEDFLPVDPSNPIYMGTVTNEALAPPGWDTPGSGIPDGDYELRVLGTDQCGHSDALSRTVTLDNTPPTAFISSPINCTCVDGVVIIQGTADDAHLVSWVLQYSGGTENGWVPIASGSNPVLGGTFAEWNTADLPGCAYVLRLIVNEKTTVNCRHLRFSEYLVTVNIGGDCAKFDFDTDNDGDVDLIDYQQFDLHFLGP
jgi:hypothetical protein